VGVRIVKKIFIIGIGAGNPEYVTIQAVNALNQVDVFFILDKGIDKEKLVTLRKEICNRFIQGNSYRFVDVPSPERSGADQTYEDAVKAWNRHKGRIFQALISDEMTDGECGAFLVWGDPTLYDSTIRILQNLVERGGHEFDFEVIPGISSVQALAARHKTSLSRIGRSIEITTGRRLVEGFPNNVDSVIVMLDAKGAYSSLSDQDIEIFWGAYVGTPDEILVSGKLRDVADEIDRIREQARKHHGWIMDTYLLRRSNDGE
jgi:precorrin-6A synthase